MDTDFYLLYDVDTFEIYSIGGSPHNDIPHKKCEARIQESTALEFISGPLRLHEYFVSITNTGYAEPIPKLSTTINKSARANNVVRDLNYRTVFIDQLNIEFEHSDKLTLLFDSSRLSTQSKYYFKTTISAGYGDSIIYVTKYNDPTALLKKYKIDIYQLSIDKTLELELDTLEKISVWGSKL
jgi:N-acetylmuramoyl-L-alanine amidase CwlA